MMKMLRPAPARYWKPVVVALLLAALALVAVIWYQYQTTKKPLSQLPAVPWVPEALAPQEPHYSLSFYGAEGLVRPLGVAVSPSGDRIYVSESGGKRLIRVFDQAGNEIGSFSASNTTEYSRVPVYLAVAPDGRLYVSDRPNRAVFVFSATGEFQGTFRPQAVGAEDWHPMGLAFDREGNLYVTDVSEGKHRVMVFDPSGALTLEFGTEGREEGQFWFPNGIAVDSRGRIYVADGNNGRVQAFDRQGQLLFVIPRGYGPADLAIPRGLAVDSDDRLFVVDTSAQVVKVYDVSGDRIAYRYDLGAYGVDNGQFRFPNGVAVDGDGRIYVTDREGGRLQVWSY